MLAKGRACPRGIAVEGSNSHSVAGQFYASHKRRAAKSADEQIQKRDHADGVPDPEQWSAGIESAAVQRSVARGKQRKSAELSEDDGLSYARAAESIVRRAGRLHQRGARCVPLENAARRDGGSV